MDNKIFELIKTADTQTLLVFLGSLLLLIYIITRFASYNYVMKNISIIIEDIAVDVVENRFKQKRQPYFTKKGSLTATAAKATQAYINQLNISCQFYSKDFYYFYRTRRPILKCRVKNMVKEYIKEHANIKFNHNYNAMTPDQFFKLRKQISGDMVGVYVIYNKNRKKYYVGQATRLFFRVNQHLTGHGNGDVYADFKRGKDKFTVKLIPLVNSGYYDLDLLEKDMIKKYNAYEQGYNKTRGNG